MKSYEISGKPVPWKRARRCGDRYFDSQVEIKDDMRSKIESIAKRSLSPSETLKVKIWFIMPIPSSWSLKRQYEAIGTFHSSRPDVDNLLKMIGDTFNNILWRDDAKIADMSGIKIYGLKPRTIIEVEDVERDIYRDQAFKSGF